MKLPSVSPRTIGIGLTLLVGVIGASYAVMVWTGRTCTDVPLPPVPGDNDETD
jgi:hypothetical protein